MFNYNETSKVFGCVDTTTHKEKTRRYGRDEVGFAYESSLTMFSLAYTPK